MIYRLALPFAALLLLGAEAAPTTPVEKAVEDAIRGRLDAYAAGNAGAWAAFVADDCICALETKAQILQAITTRSPHTRNWYGPLRDLTFRVLGDVVVARYRVSEFAEVAGKTSSFDEWRTETHARRGGKWILVAGADVVIPPDPAAITVAPSVLATYVGRYQYEPDTVDAITRDGDRLFVQTNQEPRVELFAETETTFFARGESWRIVFVKSPQGAVTGLAFRTNGQEFTAQKLP